MTLLILQVWRFAASLHVHPFTVGIGIGVNLRSVTCAREECKGEHSMVALQVTLAIFSAKIGVLIS